MCTSHSQLAKHIVKGSLQKTLCKLIWACPLETLPTLAEHTAIRHARFVFHPLKTLFCSHPQKIASHTTMQIRSWTWPFIAPWGIWSDDAWGWRRQEWKYVQFKQRGMQDLDPSSTGGQNLVQTLAGSWPWSVQEFVPSEETPARSCPRQTSTKIARQPAFARSCPPLGLLFAQFC